MITWAAKIFTFLTAVSPNGKKKAGICAQFIEGPVTSQITATALQLHTHATVVLDEEAASLLKRREYYDWVRDNKHLVQKKIGR